MEWAIGVDGGGTHTRAVLVDAEGVVQDVRFGGCGNFQRIGTNGLQLLLDQLLPPLSAQAESQNVALCLALAGAGRSAEQQEIAEMVKRIGWSNSVRVESDARAALEGAHGGAPGLVVIAGTGSIVLGKNDRGELARAGGWGPLLGDEGSGYYLGLQALQATTRYLDGAGPETELVEALAMALDMEGWDGLVPEVYGGKIDRGRIATLGPIVSDVATRGDAVAAEIVDRAGTALGGQVAAVAQRLGLLEDVTISCMGGVFAEEGLFARTILSNARSRTGVVWLRPALLPAAMGAVLLAWENTMAAPDGQRLAQLRVGRPDGL